MRCDSLLLQNGSVSLSDLQNAERPGCGVLNVCIKVCAACDAAAKAQKVRWKNFVDIYRKMWHSGSKRDKM